MAGIEAIGNDFDREENPYIKKIFNMMSGNKTEQTTGTYEGSKNFINSVFGNSSNGGSSANAGLF